MEEHRGDADAALEALPRVAASAGVTDYRPCPADLVDRELNAGAKAGAILLFIGAPDYPAALHDLPDAPPVLWARGRVDLLARPSVAMVGARNASSLGRRMARSLSAGLSGAGFVVTSGLARGIDAVAHEAALDGGTIAVVAGGVDVVYPRENADLTARMADQGLILSEMPPGLQPQARHFPRRNRLISGLSCAVVVVEAAAKSGSLITARDALDQGREVLAVPGNPLDARASGCNMLIRDGATLVRGTDDILEAIGPLPISPADPALRQPAPASRKSPAVAERPDHPASAMPASDDSRASKDLRAQIVGLLGAAPVAEDQLLRDMSLPGQQISDALLDLELDGIVTRQPGGLLALAG
jgi:DNA processing protein